MAAALLTLLNEALEYARCGWPVFPIHSARDGVCSCGGPDCDHPGKHPRTRHGLDDATTDKVQIREWWARWPDAGIGTIPGRCGYVVFDLDGPQALLEAQRVGLVAEPTLEGATGREGGRHLWYQRPDFEVGNRRGNLEHIDIRGDNGYVLLPPSIHPNGKQYHWRGVDGGAERRPRLQNALPLPPLALAFLRSINLGTEGGNPKGSLKHAVPALPERIPKGQRNAALTAEAGSIARAARDGEEIERKLIAFNLGRCDPPLSEREVLGIQKRIWAKEKRTRAEGRQNSPRASGQAVTWKMRSTDYPCSAPDALEDLGFLLDLARLIECRAEMPIDTGHGRARPAWVGDGEAEVAARYLENRWGWTRKRLRVALRRWNELGLIEPLSPFRRGRASRVRITGWVSCEPAWGQASAANKGQPCGAGKTSASKDVEEHRTTPKGQADGAEKGHNSTATTKATVRWLRLSPNLEVGFPRHRVRAA